MNEDITIDLKDLLYRVLLKWRIIVIVCVAGAILADAVGILKDVRALKAAQNVDSAAEHNAAIDEMKSLKAELNSREASEADAAIGMYETLRIRYDAILDYQKNSVFYNINPQKAPTITLQYGVDSHYRTEYPVIAQKDYSSQVVDAFISSIESEELLSSLSAQLGIEPAYVEELITEERIPEERIEGGDTFLVVIYGSDQAMCNTIADAVSARVEGMKTDLLSSYSGYTLSQMSRIYSEKFSEDMREAQQLVVNDAVNTRYNWTNIASPLSEAQRNYYNSAINVEGEEVIEENSEAPEVQESAPLPTVDYVHGKLILLGFVGGGFMVCFIIAMMYILMPVIRVKENITDGYSQTVLATVWPEKEGKAFLGCIDDWLTRIFYGRESSYDWKKRVDMLCASLKLLLGKQGVESLYLTGASDRNKKLVGDILKGLKGSVKAESGESVVYDESSLQKLSASQAVVFVESAGDSRYEEVTKELELAAQNKVQVLGFVLLQER